VIANYGYSDASGEYYITIDTGKCEGCAQRPCIAACPAAMLAEEEDPYGEVAAAVRDDMRKRVREACAPCKPARGRAVLPCVAACPYGAITHSW